MCFGHQHATVHYKVAFQYHNVRVKEEGKMSDSQFLFPRLVATCYSYFFTAPIYLLKHCEVVLPAPMI